MNKPDKKTIKNTSSEKSTEKVPPSGAEGAFALRSEEVQEILTKVPHWMIRYGNLLFLSLIVLVLFLSWLIKYPDIITAEATITTKIPPQKVYAKITKNFDSIFVKQSQEVNPNQTLAVLENTANYQDVVKLEETLDTLGLKDNSFSYPLDKMPMLFLGEIETNYAAFENNYIAYTLNKNLKPYENDLTANKLSRHELKNRFRNLKNQREINKSELEFKKKKLDRNKKLFKKGVISAQEYEKNQLEYLTAQRNFKNISSSMAQIKTAIADNQKTFTSTTINKTRDELTLLKKTIQSFHQLKKSIKDWEFEYVLKSEIKGKVSFFNYWNNNQTVNQGDLVFTIVPSEDSPYIAKLKTPIQNSGKIKIGQNVNIKLQNYPEAEFGMLRGKVENISLVPNNNDEKFYYLINVKLPKKLITSYNKTIKFKGEMLGTAEIVTADLRLINRFFYQFKDLFKR